MSNFEHSVFIIIPPGFEALSLKELELKFSKKYECISTVTGGVEINSDLSTVLNMNHNLKIPSRILIRIETFKCRDLPKLYNRVRKIDWNRWTVGLVPMVKSSSSNSRLFDSRKIESTVIDGIKRRYKEQPPKKREIDKNLSKNLQVLIRFENDTCTISLDSSGERLGKRGYKIASTVAPIRENLAAALTFSLFNILNNSNRTLVDPMCGGGTFALEAATFFTPNIARNYSIELITTDKIMAKDNRYLFKEFICKDIDYDSIKVAKINLKDIPNCKVVQDDLLKKEKRLDNPAGNVVIINPPYGLRIQIKEKNTLYFNSIIENTLEKFSPEIIGIIIPRDINFSQLKIRDKVKVIEKIEFKNSNIPVNWYCLKRIL